MLYKIAAKLAMLKQDRGEGPVPYIILVAIIAGVAVLVGFGVRSVAQGWINQLGTVR